MVEVATIGREGMLGVSAVLNGDPSPAAAMVQAETDTCYRMAVDAFRGEMDRRGPFHHLMTRYAQALVGFIMQSTACNAVHSVEQRLARWLLMAHDRIGTRRLPADAGIRRHDARREPADRDRRRRHACRRPGLITYHRGHVTIVDREKLEAASCECYRTATDLLKKVTRTHQP